jgi:hypothetical protein
LLLKFLKKKTPIPQEALVWGRLFLFKRREPLFQFWQLENFGGFRDASLRPIL